MTRRKVFEPTTVPTSFWRRGEVQVALARREVGRLFQLYLEEFPGCTQTQLAVLTEHDRAEVSNFVRGTRQQPVSDIEVLVRVADGLRMPDEARVLLGLAPADALVSSVREPPPAAAGQAHPASSGFHDSSDVAPPHVAICGSRAEGTETDVIDAAVRALARLVMTRRYQVTHGPVGVGIEVMTYIADHYHPPEFTMALGRFGRRNVVREPALIIVVGGGAGTQVEIDLALSMGKKVLALPTSGGTARRFHDQARRDPRLQDSMSHDQFTALDNCTDVEEFARLVDDLLTHDRGALQ